MCFLLILIINSTTKGIRIGSAGGLDFNVKRNKNQIFIFSSNSQNCRTENIFKDLWPALQLKLRFISPAINVPQSNINDSK